LIQDAQRTFEQHRRKYADIFVQDSDSDNEEEKHNSLPATNSDRDEPTSTDSDSSSSSDSETSSSHDETHPERKISKKKVHKHQKGPLKSYFEERIGNWPKYRYKKYKKNHMKKHGIQISYGNIHTKEIKHSLKIEKHERKKQDPYPVNVTMMMDNLAKQTSFLSLDPEHPIVPIELDEISLSSFRSAENEPVETKSTSTLHKMKEKVKKSFKRKKKISSNTNINDGDDEQMATHSDATSHTSVGDESQKSNQSLDKL
jgi:hypothetical protein